MAGSGTSLMMGPRETVGGSMGETSLNVEQAKQLQQPSLQQPQQPSLQQPLVHSGFTSPSTASATSSSPVSLAINSAGANYHSNSNKNMNNAPAAFDHTFCETENGNNDTEEQKCADLLMDNASAPLVSAASVSASVSVSPHVEHYYHNQAIYKSRENVLQRLSEALLRRSLSKIDLSQRGLQPSDARLVKMALLQNTNLKTLKLGYNNLGDLGVTLLASGIAVHKSLVSLDLGFNNFGDDGCRSLALALREAAKPSPFQQQDQHILPQQSQNSATSSLHGERGTLQTLYLAGNSIGEDGAIALADCIRHGCSLHKLYLTGNRIGSEGIRELTDAIVEVELYRRNNSSVEAFNALYDSENTVGDAFNKVKLSYWGMQELFLGGNGMERGSCRFVASLLEKSCNLRVISLSNCSMNDEDIMLLATGIKANRRSLPIESIQLSFNNMTHAGLEPLMNSLWESQTLQELKVDNNLIGDRGAHHVAAILPCLANLEVLDVGFNTIKSIGLNALMKAVAESRKLRSLSVSGNDIDVVAAKAVAYALAYNRSLKSIFLVHCSILHEGQRHITAGAVSNNQTLLRKLTGFEIGPVVVTLGFPPALEHWTNEQVLNFIHLMWNKSGGMEPSDLEREMDPLHFLSTPDDMHRLPTHKPLEASVVVEVAKKTFETLVADGVDVFSRRRDNVFEPSFGSPLAGDTIMVDSNERDSSTSDLTYDSYLSTGRPPRHNNGAHLSMISDGQARSFVVAPEVDNNKRFSSDPARKKRIVEWLCSNIKHMNGLARLPFNSRELWRLHQHYFSPVVNECGGTLPSVTNDRIVSSVPEVTRVKEGGSSDSPMSNSSEVSTKASSNVLPAAPGVTSLPLLKRKVSYRFLGDAMVPAQIRSGSAFEANIHSRAPSVARMIEDGHTGHSLPPKSKRARRNRTRISFLPRIKAKLDSYLDVCHEKALITMRQLYFVEQAILSGQVNPLDQNTPRRTHLSGILASEAETIIVDMT